MMDSKEINELQEILGQIVECLTYVPRIPQDKFENLNDSVSKFRAKLVQEQQKQEWVKQESEKIVNNLFQIK